MPDTVRIIYEGDSAGAVRAAQQVNASLDGVEKKAGGIGSVLKNALSFGGGMLLAGGVEAAIGGLKAGLDVATEFESSLNFLQAVSGATADEMDQISAKAKALGADMTLPATSAGDAALAMTELAKAGLTVNDAMAAAQGTLQLAAAGQLEEARAAEITAGALNAFGLAGSEANRIADLLAASANASAADVTGMADALQMSSAVFAAANVPIEDLVTSIGLMANAGIQGSDAGTSLKTMLLSLEAPTKKSAELMDELGLRVYDAQGNMLPMRDLIGQFTDKLGGMTQQQRDAALATIFGSDAVRAANVVMLGGTDGFDKMSEAVTRSGAAQELAAAKTKGLAGAFGGLQSQLETVLLSAIEPFLPMLEDMVRGIADLLGSPAVQEGITKFTTSITTGIQNVIAFFQRPDVQNAIGTFVEGIKTAIDTVMAVFQNPQVQAVLSKFIEIFRVGLEAEFKLAVEAFQLAIQGIGMAIDGLVAFFQRPDVQAAIGTLVTNISTGVEKILGFAQTLGQTDFAGIIGKMFSGEGAGAVGGILAGIQTDLQGFLSWLNNELAPALSEFGVVFQRDAMPVLREFGGWLNTVLVPAFEKLGGWINENLIPALRTFGGLVGEELKAKLAILGENIVISVETLTTLTSWIFTEGIPALEKFAGVINTSVNEAIKTMDKVWKSIVGAFEKATGFINDTRTALGNMGSYIGDTLQGILDPFLTTVQSIRDAFAGLWDFIKKVIGALQDLGGVIPGAAAGIADTAGGVVGGITDAVGGALGGLGGALGLPGAGNLLPQSVSPTGKIGPQRPGVTNERAFNNYGSITVHANNVDEMLNSIEERLGGAVQIRRRNQE